MPFSHRVTVSDPANAGGSANAVLKYDLEQALDVWSRYLDGSGALVVSLNIASTTAGRMTGGPAATIQKGMQSGVAVYEASAEYVLATGQRVSGSMSDITVTVDLGYFGQLDLSPNLSYSSAVAANKYNPIVVFMHELFHGFGMSGAYNSSGVRAAPAQSEFDALLQSSSGSTSFVGKTAQAVYGGPVPITTTSATQNYYHFGNTQSDLNRTPTTVSDPLTLDLMNGIVFYYNYQYGVSPLDLAVLQDLGYKLSPLGQSLVPASGPSSVITNNSPAAVVVGTSSDDTINALGGNATVTGGAGNDTIAAGSGTNSAVYAGLAKNYTITLTAGSQRVSVQDKIGTDGTDTLTGIQALRFSDQTLDTSWFTKTAALSGGQLVSLVNLYVASFNRAPDALGLDYWGSQLHDGVPLPTIAASFFVQPEATVAYPAGQPTQAFVSQVCGNVLGRSPDAAGLNYWTSQLQSGGVGKNTFLLAVINGAMNDDAQYLANKEAVGAHFALTQGLSNTVWAKSVMAGVSGSATSVTAANQSTDFYANSVTGGGAELVVKIVGIAS